MLLMLDDREDLFQVKEIGRYGGFCWSLDDIDSEKTARHLQMQY